MCSGKTEAYYITYESERVGIVIEPKDNIILSYLEMCQGKTTALLPYALFKPRFKKLAI